MTAPLDRRRRALLSGRPDRLRLRPPPARLEAQFLERCTRCDDCLRACPEQVLVRGEGGFPEFDPARGECTFCMACSDACLPAALDPLAARPWLWKVELEVQQCLASAGVHCQGCRDACSSRAIQFPMAAQPRPPQISADRCTGCGACVGVCPGSALRLEAAWS